MNNRSPIQRSISWLLVGLIGLFALTSLGNVAEFVHQYHKGWTGVTLGGGFGVTVFVCAYLAATAKTKSTRFWSLIVGGIFGLASGAFQAWLYIEGGAIWHVAALLSFVPIVVGEVGLALVESSYSKEHVEDFGLTEVQNQLDDLRTEYDRVCTELDEVRLRSEGVQKQSDQRQKQLDEVRSRLDQMQKQLDRHSVDSVLSRLDDGKRDKMVRLLDTVNNHRVQGPADLVKLSDFNKADAYALWPVAQAADLVYLNGDGAYHTNGQH